MTDSFPPVSRRRFLGGVALLGAAPLAAGLEGLPQTGAKKWTGDDFDEGHDRLRNPRAYWEELRAVGRREEVAGTQDVIIVGGGISGLTVAHQLAKQERDPKWKILLLEREAQTGGVSKSDNWEGIEFALGAAYMVNPEPGEDEDPEDPSQERRNLDLLIELGLRKEHEDLHNACGLQRRWSGNENHVVFNNRRVLEEHEILSEENIKFFEGVAESDNFPSIPPEDTVLVQKLDSISFQQFLRDGALQHELYGRRLGEIPPAGWEAIEYYFWGAFGTNTWETSAYHGLNFYAAEFTKILVFPGGNAFIAKALTRKVNEMDAGLIRTGNYVLLIEPEPSADPQKRAHPETWLVRVVRGGRGYTYRTRSVVFASPLFLAKRMLPGLPDEQMRALDSLDYRSFVVANVLLDAPIRAIFQTRPAIVNSYEMQRVHGTDPRRHPPEEISGRGVFSDIVNATFVHCGQGEKSVLTVYRPYPYAHGREKLRYLSYEYVETEVRRAVLQAYGEHGLKPEHIREIRLSRWGHPMIIPRPGQVADGIIARAAQPHYGLFFSHTECQGAPAIENALASAYAAAEAVEGHLAGARSNGT